MSVDADGDTKPGFTAVPRSGGGYVAPPTGLGIFGSAPTADKLYLVWRTVVSLAGNFTSCEEQSGTANVTFFDSHVVGCHVAAGDCAAAQTDFVDQSRTLYKPGSATFVAKKVPDGASCADVRMALPM
jgi:prepilin-type processing-associated H-X9-DG protein